MLLSMIYLIYIGGDVLSIYLTHVSRLPTLDVDFKYAIMRSYKYPAIGVSQLAELSPSSKLYSDYLSWKSAGLWSYDYFMTKYAPRFLLQIGHDTIAKDRLNKLYKWSKEGANIALGCACTSESMCHRSIVGGLLSGAGAEVITETGQSYVEFYEMYERIKL